MTKILMLDFDGVLHPDSIAIRDRETNYPVAMSPVPTEQLMMYAPILAEILSPFDVQIIICSHWAALYGEAYCRSVLPAEIAEKVIGTTYSGKLPPKKWATFSRFEQITVCAYDRKIPFDQQLICVDDDDRGWDPAFRDNLVLTHSHHALGNPAAQALLFEKLSRK